MESINFWSDTKQLIQETSQNSHSIRCSDVVRRIPLYECIIYDGYLDFAKNIYNTQYGKTFRNWKYAMTIDKTGYCNCPSYFTDEIVDVYGIMSSATNIKCNHHYYTYNHTTKKDILDFDRVVELGGGLGDMAKFIRNMGFRGEYIIIDLPEVLELQKQNLNGYDVQFTTDVVGYLENTLFISTWALSECPLSWRESVINNLQPESYLIIYQSNFEGISNKDYFSSWDGIEIDIPWIRWDGGSYYLLK